MFNKTYKKGMNDAAKAYEAFGEKQSEALEHILGEVRNGNCTLEEAVKKLADIEGNVDNLFKYLLGKEKAQLYTVYTPLDIADLDKEEKLFLVGVLFRLTIDKTPTEAQQKFIRSVQHYLDIKEPPFGVDISAIEKIESMNAQKAIYQVVLEYLMLQEGDSYDETEIQHDLLDSFNLNNKNRQTIAEHVRLLYIATGAEGFVEKYGFVNDEERDEEEIISENENTTEEEPHETTNTNFKEPYVGISLQIAEKICSKDVTHQYVGDAHFYTQQFYFETRNYFVIANTNDISWSCINKDTHSISLLKSLEKRNIKYSFSRKEYHGADCGAKYVVDYQDNFVYYLFEKHLYGINIKKDFCVKYDTEIPTDEITSMQLYENTIVMTSSKKLFYFDIQKQCLETVTDVLGNEVGYTTCTATVLEDNIYFYTTRGDTITSEEGGSILNSICIYNLTLKKVIRIITLSSGGIEAIFRQNRTIYVVCYDSTSKRFLKKMITSNGTYKLDTVLEYQGCEIKIYHNWFCCYRKSKYSSSDQPLDSILVYDFSKSKSEIVVDDCKAYKNDGIFKPKWIRSESDYKILGEWLYYIRDHVIYDLTNKRERMESHIHRLNLNSPMKAVDLGKVSKDYT